MRREAVVAVVVGILLSVFVPQSVAGGTKYRSDVKHRPRIAFDGRDKSHVNRVKGRIERNEAPWADAYRALHRLATKGKAVHYSTTGWSGQSDPYNVLYGQESRNGGIAAAKALVAWLYAKGMRVSWLPLPKKPGQATSDGWVKDQAAASARIIRRMYDDWPCYRGFKVINRGIVVASSLMMHCLAYDFLAALPSRFRPSLSSAEKPLSHLAADFRRWYWTVGPQHSNHGIRVASALGVAGLVLNRLNRYRWWKPSTWRYRPSRWMKLAVRELHPTGRRSDLKYQMRSGAYAEGSSYYHYAADLYLPFFHAYNRFHKGGGVPFLRSSLVNDGTTWMFGLRLPDGRRPPVDNSSFFKDPTPAYFLSRVRNGVRSANDKRILQWDYSRNGFPGMTGARAAFLLAAYDPTPLAAGQVVRMASPGKATRFLSRQGQAVLRSGWGLSDAYCLVMAEQGEARSHGNGHDSVDQGAFLFYARRDLITLDPGYGGFSQVEKINRAEHHSMILVDGKGPRPAYKWLRYGPWRPSREDARIVRGPRTGESGSVRSVEVETAYQGAKIDRTMVLVGDRYLLVEDRCQSGRTRDFTTLIHANAGAKKDRPLRVNGTNVTYQTNLKKVEVAVGAAATAPLRVETTRRFDATGERPAGHESIDYTASGRTVRFLSAIATGSPRGKAPRVGAVSVGGGAIALRVEVDGRIDIVVSNPGRRTIQVPATRGTSAFSTKQALSIRAFTGSGVAGKRVWDVK